MAYPECRNGLSILSSDPKNPEIDRANETHLQNIHKIKTATSSQPFICETCNMTTMRPAGMINQVNGPVHQNNLLRKNQRKMKTINTNPQSIGSYHPLNYRNYLPAPLQHIVDLKHQSKVRTQSTASITPSSLVSQPLAATKQVQNTSEKTTVSLDETSNSSQKCINNENCLPPFIQFCSKCQVNLTLSSKNVDQHMRGAKRNNLFGQKKNSSSKHSAPSASQSFSSDQQLPPMITNILHESKIFSNKESKSENVHVENFKSTDVLSEGIEDFGKKNLFCTICNLWISKSDSIDYHITTIKHMSNGPKVIQRSGSREFECKACNCKIKGIFILQTHLTSAKHLSNRAVNSSINQITETKRSDIKSRCDKRKNVRKRNNCLKNTMTSSNLSLPQSKSTSIGRTNSQKNAPVNKSGFPEPVSFTITASQRRIKAVTIKCDKSTRNDQQTMECSLCNLKFKSVSGFHAHLSQHFWPRFLKNSLTEISDDTKENRQHSDADSNNLTSIDLLDCKFTKAVEDVITEPQPYRKRPLDIDIDDGINIYKVNKQKMEDLHLGVLLIIASGQDNLYCLICRTTIKNSIQTLYEHLFSIYHLNCLQLMIEDHKLFKDYPNELSDLALGYQYMEEINDFLVKCYVCRISLPNDTSSLNEHIRNVSHINRWSTFAENPRAWCNALSFRMHCDFYTVNIYWCILCNAKFSVESEFRRHMYDKKHLKRIDKFSILNKKLIFDYCAVCTSLWFGFYNTFGYHSKCAMHKYRAGQSYCVVTKLPISAEQLLHSPENKVNRLLDEIDNLQTENRKTVRSLIRDLEAISREKYPNCVAHPFGSRITNLGGSRSDLDVFLDCSTSKYSAYNSKNSSRKQIVERLKAIKGCLLKHPKVWQINREVFNGRTPIITTVHLPTAIECDISFSNGLAVASTHVVKSYCEKFPNCRKMIIFIKNWMNHCHLTGRGGIPSCAINWMIIFFLQLKGVLPSVAELIAKNNQSRLIRNWETGVDLHFEVIDIGESFRKLLAIFFAFYADFDYRNEVICPLLGRSVKKMDFRKRVLPKEMTPDCHYLESNEHAQRFRIDSILCVQDPFDVSNNVTKAVKKVAVYRLKFFCSRSVDILEKN